MTELKYEFLITNGWKPVTDQQKDGKMYLLIVISEDRPTEDEFYHRTIGCNNLLDNGQDVWLTSGWCWCNDEFTQNKIEEGVLYYQELPPMFETIS